MADDSLIAIEVACATACRQALLTLSVPPGTTLIEAVHLSGVEALFPDLDVATAPRGIFGTLMDDSYQVQAGDRVEIYRMLLTDPKEARRRRAARQEPDTG